MRQDTGTARGARIAVRLSRKIGSDRRRESSALHKSEHVHPGGNPERAEWAANSRRMKTESQEGLSAYPVTISALSGASRRSMHCWILLSKQFLCACRSHPSTRSPGCPPSQGPVPPADQDRGQAMSGDAPAASRDLVIHGTN
jgi:hypothetical protein